jgi:AbrB family looped-hinge helix DNA binding protein
MHRGKIMRQIWASVTDRGQVTIPSEVRKHLGIEKREKIIFAIEDGTVVLKKPRFTVETAAGSVPPLKPAKDWQQVEREVKEEIAERYLQKMREGNA